MRNLLANALAASAVARINYNTKKIIQQFGYNSTISQDRMADILAMIPAENIKYKNGVPTIIKPSKLVKADVDLSVLDNKKRYIDYKKEYEKEYDVYKYEQEFDNKPAMKLNEFISKRYNVKTNIIDAVKYISGMGATTDVEQAIINIMSQPVKTYADMFKVAELVGDL